MRNRSFSRLHSCLYQLGYSRKSFKEIDHKVYTLLHKVSQLKLHQVASRVFKFSFVLLRENLITVLIEVVLPTKHPYKLLIRLTLSYILQPTDFTVFIEPIRMKILAKLLTIVCFKRSYASRVPL